MTTPPLELGEATVWALVARAGASPRFVIRKIEGTWVGYCAYCTRRTYAVTLWSSPSWERCWRRLVDHAFLTHNVNL